MSDADVDSRSRDNGSLKSPTGCVVGSKKIGALFVVGILLVVAGAVCYFMVDRLIQKKIDEKLVLSPNSDGYQQWQDPSVPIYLQFFVFNVTNPDEVKENKPPFLVQKGPYSYREHRPKENISWDEKGAAVSYNQWTTYVFDTKTSCSSCNPFDDYVRTVNIPLVTLAEAAKDLPVPARIALAVIFERFNENLVMKRRVQDLLWGYEDPIFVWYNSLRKKYKIMQKYLPEIPTVVALQKNNTYDGNTTVHTGAHDIKQLLQWMEWKGMKHLSVWNTTFANMINGTDGSQFSPDVHTTDKFYVFVTQLCRSLYLTYNSKADIQGIGALQFTVPKEVYLAPSLNPDNQGFCTKKCYPSGILDVGVCQPPSPISIPLFASAPHFYLGDPSLLKAVEGLSPNKDEHGTVLYVEPHTGISIKSSKRLQVNVKVEAVSAIPQTHGVNKMFLPVIWINETATIDSDSAHKLKTQVLRYFTIVRGLEFGLIALGSLLFLIAVVLLVLRVTTIKKLKKAREMLVVNGASERSPLLSS